MIKLNCLSYLYILLDMDVLFGFSFFVCLFPSLFFGVFLNKLF